MPSDAIVPATITGASGAVVPSDAVVPATVANHAELCACSSAK